jgi:hypothetical protein
MIDQSDVTDRRYDQQIIETKDLHAISMDSHQQSYVGNQSQSIHRCFIPTDLAERLASLMTDQDQNDFSGKRCHLHA